MIPLFIVAAIVLLFYILFTDCTTISGGRRWNHTHEFNDIGQLIIRSSKFGNDQIKKTFTNGIDAVLNKPPVGVIKTLDDISGELQYHYGNRIFTTSVHIGQRKLFCNELKFICEHVTTNRGKKLYIIYAGAAPGHHIGYLSDLINGDDFDITFILVDPAPFSVFGKTPVIITERTLDTVLKKPNEKLFVINGYFTNSLAKAVAKLFPGSYFISDIRTNVYEDESGPNTLDILWNLAQQYNWLRLISPNYAMLKFRHPFYSEDPAVFKRECKKKPYVDDFKFAKTKIGKLSGIDFVKNFDIKELQYLDGAIDIQPFPGEMSTETRLVTDCTTVKNYGTLEKYESTLHYYNCVLRQYQAHINENIDQELGFDNCNDCALENYIWEMYRSKYPLNFARFAPNGIRDLVKKLSDTTQRSLIRGPHGKFFERHNPRFLQRSVQRIKR